MSTPTQEEHEDDAVSGNIMTDDESEYDDFSILEEIDNVRSPLNVYYCSRCDEYKTDYSNVEEIQDHEAQHEQEARRDLNLGEFLK